MEIFEGFEQKMIWLDDNLFLLRSYTIDDLP